MSDWAWLAMVLAVGFGGALFTRWNDLREERREQERRARTANERIEP